MDSIFEDDKLKEMLQRVSFTRPEYQAQWGKMKVEQMLAHVNITIEAALGIIKLPSESNLLMRWIVKPMVLSNRPVRKNSPTAKGFHPPEAADFQTEKQRLMRNLQAAHDRGLKGPWEPSVSFGPLKAEEWGRLIYKHTDHHLTQFGS